MSERRGRPFLAGLLLAAALAAGGAGSASAARREIPARGDAAETAILEAADGDTLLLGAGVHRGPLILSRRLLLRGAPGAVLDGGGAGTVLTVAAAGAAVESLTIRGSGNGALTLDAGVHVVSARGVRLRGLRVVDVLYGIAGERADSLVIEGCDLTGRVHPSVDVTPEMNEAAGNGVHLWYCRDVAVRRVAERRFMDGVYLSFVDRIVVEDGRFSRNGRYGLHTMYCQDNRLARNRFQFNLAGCAIMFSNHLELSRNDFVHNRGPRTYGVLLRDCSDGHFLENRMVDNTVAVFMDNSNRNVIRRNLVQDNGWGVILFSSCAGNEFAENDFVNDDYPVALDMRYSDNRFDDGRRGNYWSGNAPYDLDGDGASDVPYSPVSAFAFLSKRYPDLAILAQSPAANALTMAERTIPALRPSQIVDRFPLVAPAPVGAGAGGSRGTRAAGDEAPGARRGSFPTAAAFLLLAAAGLRGVASRGGPR
ncbi:MAG TPA: nitrous oxide reductase family maturation protein NosD [Candidatus Eisenbacteria bacterium]